MSPFSAETPAVAKSCRGFCRLRGWAGGRRSSCRAGGPARATRGHGNLQATGQAIIGESGVVQGDVHSADLLVFGRLEGNVHAKCVQLKPTARILGDIETETLEVEPGAHYQGAVKMAGGADRLPAPQAMPLLGADAA